MAILNYSTTISVDKTVGEIQGLLARRGARSILVDYDGQGNPTAIAFMIPTRFGDRGFRLPANIEAVWKVLTKQHQQGKVQRRFTTREQAARVGWRIVKDWLEAQVAIIETEMVTIEQVFLPYMQVKNGQTLYQVMQESRFRLTMGDSK